MKIRTALSDDLARIVEIYNQAIPSRRITADLDPVTVEERQSWFAFHYNNPRYPLWVLETDERQIVGWCSFSPFYPRKAFDQTAEISIYLDNSAKSKGYGKSAVEFMKNQMLHCGINTLMAYVIEENHISRFMFEKLGFQQWGRYPSIANMGDSLQTFLMYGFQRFE
ncbi:phosphinothricin acetyltransferase [Cricetibacter osteomyelitidis]|uniref:Phosphinothricin acetyltransferase n=1 Tax=Cricetibacter osteomyelitidis TaxID=1521931 RepID=A0A4R2SZB0_9PAST|nr:GNAT family N-acetyltransferase [Cricetibacter osteomyelitidis]TCP94865.1 phosphinothricin acetyltransferase [Cricetibacter osteomyelitidis]